MFLNYFNILMLNFFKNKIILIYLKKNTLKNNIQPYSENLWCFKSSRCKSYCSIY
jgi:hypothetical protein